MLELYIIKYLLNIEYYNKYRKYIKIKKEEKELNILYNILDELINIYNRNITFEEYSISVLNKYPYTHLLDQISKAEIAPEFLQNSVATIVERQIAYDIAITALHVSEGKKELSALKDLIASTETKEKVEETIFVTSNLEELYNETTHNRGLRWRLDTLNKMLGSLRRGDFGFIFARPETGKTTFLASEVTFFAEQVDRPIIWFNLEEQGSKVMVRCYQAAHGAELSKLFSNRERAQEIYQRRTKDNIKIYDNASLHKHQVEKICNQIKPALIIFDQIDKIKGFVDDREDLRLGSIYIWARELAKTHCPVIGVSQADGSGEGKKWLDMSNVANAKTSKQAEADWILGIGATHEIGLEHIRYLHLSKNKLTGDEDTIPALRHGKCEVVIKPEIARYEDFK